MPLDRLAALELERDLAALRAGRGRLRLEPHVDPALAQRVGDLLARERLVLAEQPLGALDQDHLGAERPPRLGHLDARPRRRRARAGSRARDLRARRLAVGPVVDRVEPVDRRDRRRAAGRERDRLARDEDVVADPDPPLAVELRVAAEELDPASPRAREAAPSRPSRGSPPCAAPASPSASSSPVTASAAPGTRRVSASASAGSEQRLRRHAGVVGALAADQLVLDDRRLEAAVGGASGADLAGRPGPDHDEVELALRHTANLPTCPLWGQTPRGSDPRRRRSRARGRSRRRRPRAARRARGRRSATRARVRAGIWW